MDSAEGRLDSAESDIGTLQTEIRAIDASWITSGTVNIERLPAASLERMHVVSTVADLANVTATQAQNGDTIKVNATGAMFYVIDDSKLGTNDYMDGLTEYTAGAASSVPWSGITGKPDVFMPDVDSSSLATYSKDASTGDINVNDSLVTALAKLENKAEAGADERIPNDVIDSIVNGSYKPTA
jgi:hypothetical protein